MTVSEAIHKMEYMRNGYQMLLDEKVMSGTVVGHDVQGVWASDTPLSYIYAQQVEACEMAIAALKKLEG